MTEKGMTIPSETMAKRRGDSKEQGGRKKTHERGEAQLHREGKGKGGLAEEKSSLQQQKII